MKEVELVIKIPEETYKGIMLGKWDENGLAYYVKDGTPLPKGHGRLIDANRLRSMYSINRANFNTVVGIQKWIDEAPTIIEAERSEEE